MKLKVTSIRKLQAFTLIELLVVIAIISLLSAILFPVFGRVRAKAKQVSCMSNLKQMGYAFMQYQHDNDDYTTPPYNTKPRVSSDGRSAFWFGSANPDGSIFWDDSPLAPYNPSYQLMDCPESPRPSNPNNQVLYNRKSIGFGYGNNQKIFNPSARPKKIGQFTDPAQTVVLADSGWFNFGEVKPSYYIYYPDYVRNSDSGSPVPPDDNPAWEEQSGGIRAHTNGFANVLWSDYHVSAVKLSYRKADSAHAKAGLGDIIHPKFGYALRDQPAGADGFTGNQKIDWYFEVVKPPLPN